MNYDYVALADQDDIWHEEKLDRQIKFMGHRIELEDIEHAINKINNVKGSVACFGKKNDVSQIVSWIEHKTSLKKIKSALLKSLPIYMMPRSIIEIKKLPRNNNGKLDRLKLYNEYFN